MNVFVEVCENLVDICDNEAVNPWMLALTSPEVDKGVPSSG